MLDSTERFEITLPDNHEIAFIDAVMSRKPDGSWGMKPHARIREDIAEWAKENDIRIGIAYPSNASTLLFRTAEAALLFKLTWL